MNRGITTAILLLLITFVVSCTGSSAGCDCYSYWLCDGPADVVFPDQCSTGPANYYGQGSVPFTYLIHTTSPDQAYRLINANCVEEVSFGNCDTQTDSVRTDLHVQYTCDGSTTLCLADTAAPANSTTYTFDQAGSTIGCNDTCFSTASECAITESLVPNACFPISALEWCLNGNAVFTTAASPSIELTSGVDGLSGSAFINQPFNAAVDGFTVTATVQVTNNGQTTPADGFAFVVQQIAGCNALGIGGGGIGYDGLINALAVEFDVFLDGSFNDPDNHHIGVQASQANGYPVDMVHFTATTVIDPISVAPIAVQGGSLYHTIIIQYVASTTSLTVSYDGAAIISNQNIGVAITQLGLTSAYVGFTASTGAAEDEIIITNVEFSSP